MRAAGRGEGHRGPAVTGPPTVSVQTLIEAPLKVVWAVLVDFKRYPEWNPFTVRVETSSRVGDSVLMDVMLGGKLLRLRERMRVFEPERRFGWGLYIGRGHLLDCIRVQQLESVAERRTRYLCHEAFRGLLVPLFFRRYEERMKRGFVDAAEALKRRAEQVAAAGRGDG
jgi:hypothetical protein